MGSVIANYIIAYGFVIRMGHNRYFKATTCRTDMQKARIRERWKEFVSEVGEFGRYCDDVRQQSKRYVLGERILSGQDGTLHYEQYPADPSSYHDIQKEVFDTKLRHKRLIDKEARLNNTAASYLLFRNDR